MEFNASRVDVGFRHINGMVKRLLDIQRQTRNIATKKTIFDNRYCNIMKHLFFLIFLIC